ncbi:MAG: hypothetical protein ABIH49_02535 [archaeon]
MEENDKSNRPGFWAVAAIVGVSCFATFLGTTGWAYRTDKEFMEPQKVRYVDINHDGMKDIIIGTSGMNIYPFIQNENGDYMLLSQIAEERRKATEEQISGLRKSTEQQISDLEKTARNYLENSVQEEIK